MSDSLKVKILNVEDYAASREATSDLLREAGYEVLEAAGGAEALRLVAEAHPQLVLLDVNLPDLSGHEVCRRIKSRPATAATLVLQTSGEYLRSEDKVRGLDAGADGYLVKPVEPTVLLATIKSLLRLGRAEAAQRESEQRLGLALRSAQLGTWDFNPLTEELHWDDRCKELFGLPPAAVVDYTTFLAGLHPDDRARAHEAVQQALNPAGGGDYDIEYRTVGLRDGVERWIAANGRAYLDDEGRACRLIGTVFDITERKRAEEARRESDRRKDEFLAMLAHELRNPLAPIRNATEVLRAAGADEAGRRLAREVIERQVDHMTRLLDDLLDVSRITQGKILLERRPVTLADVFAHAVETSRSLLDDRRHEFTVSLPAEPLVVSGDLTRLAQVVANLLTNAAKYTDPGGRISLAGAREAGPAGEEAVIRVSDNGMGMPAELLPRVFDLFAQAERTLDRSQGGLGIGLTLVRRLTEMHGGSVEAVSGGPGRGSEFVVRLPVVRGAEFGVPSSDETAVQAATTNHESRSTNLLRVLVVDDNEDSAESLALIFSLKGHEVRTAHDGHAALAAAEDFAPDVALLDIGLPGLDGYELARRLRAMPAVENALLVALTGYGQERDREQALAAGFNQHLVKPVDFAALLRLVTDHQAARGAAVQ